MYLLIKITSMHSHYMLIEHVSVPLYDHMDDLRSSLGRPRAPSLGIPMIVPIPKGGGRRLRLTGMVGYPICAHRAL